MKNIKTTEYYDIPGYEGKYKINFYGHIRRNYKKGHRDLRPYKNSKGRSVIKLNCKEQAVSKLMKLTFIGELQEEMVLYHKNGIITDNCLANLEVITKSEADAIKEEQ